MSDTIERAVGEALERLSEAERQRVIELTSYHVPTAEQAACYGAINLASRLMIAVVLNVTPECADQSAAVRLIREARMTANAAIACRGVS